MTVCQSVQAQDAYALLDDTIITRAARSGRMTFLETAILLSSCQRRP